MAVTPFYDYASSAGAGAIAVPANRQMIEVSCIAGPAGATVQIGTGQPLVPVPGGTTFWTRAPDDSKKISFGPIIVTFAGDVAGKFVSWGGPS